LRCALCGSTRLAYSIHLYMVIRMYSWWRPVRCRKSHNHR